MTFRHWQVNDSGPPALCTGGSLGCPLSGLRFFLVSAPAEKVRVELSEWTGWRRIISGAGWRNSGWSHRDSLSVLVLPPYCPRSLISLQPSLAWGTSLITACWWLFAAHMTKPRHKPGSLCPVLLCGPAVASDSGPGTTGVPPSVAFI